MGKTAVCQKRAPAENSQNRHYKKVALFLIRDITTYAITLKVYYLPPDSVCGGDQLTQHSNYFLPVRLILAC